MNYAELATKEIVQKTSEALKKRNFEVIIVDTKEQAFKKIKELIPAGASVNNGSSRTLEEIGFIEYLKSGTHAWNNLHAAVLAEKDPAKQAELRKQSSFAEYYLGSVHALAQSGEMVIASASGSQLPSVTFASQNLILVVGAQKITPDLPSAIQRMREHVFPLENERMKSVGMGGSMISKILILEQEPPFMHRKARVILVNEKLGF